MDDIRDTIKLEALNLEIGESSPHTVCPKCGGGKSREKSLVVTRDLLGLLYTCHRNSCGAKGFIPSRANPMAVVKKEKEPRPFRGETRHLNEREYDFFKYHFGLGREDVSGFKWSEDRERIIMPCYTSLGYEWGCVARGYKELAPFDGPKSITYYNDTNHPLISFYGRGNKAVFVEDIISAIKVNKATGRTAIALLGTHITYEGIVSVLDAGVEDVIIWLDSDAQDKATRISWDYSLSFRDMRCLITEQGAPDPKDRSLTNILQTIGG